SLEQPGDRVGAILVDEAVFAALGMALRRECMTALIDRAERRFHARLVEDLRAVAIESVFGIGAAALRRLVALDRGLSRRQLLIAVDEVALVIHRVHQGIACRRLRLLAITDLERMGVGVAQRL